MAGLLTLGVYQSAVLAASFATRELVSGGRHVATTICVDGDRRRRVLTDGAEGRLVLCRNGIFHPEQPVRLEALAEARGFNRRQPVMDVVQQVNAMALIVTGPRRQYAP